MSAGRRVAEHLLRRLPVPVIRTNEELDEESEYYETDDAHHIWDHTDDWDLEIKLTKTRWVVTEKTWAKSRLENDERRFFYREFYWEYDLERRQRERGQASNA